MLCWTTFDIIKIFFRFYFIFTLIYREQYLNNKTLDFFETQRTSTKRRRPLRKKFSKIFNKNFISRHIYKILTSNYYPLQRYT